MYIFFAACLAFTTINLLSAERVEVPQQGVYGQCSAAKVNQISFDVKLGGPITGVYLLPKPEYEKLLAASKSGDGSDVKFNYFLEYSCTGGSVTACSKYSGSSTLGPDPTCVALVNTGNDTVNAEMTIRVDSAAAPIPNAPSNSNSGGGQISVVAVVLAVVGGICAAVLVGILGVVGWRKYRKDQQKPPDGRTGLASDPPEPSMGMQKAPQFMPADHVYSAVPHGSYIGSDGTVYTTVVANVQPLQGFYPGQEGFGVPDRSVVVSEGSEFSPQTISQQPYPADSPNLTTRLPGRQ